MKILENPNPVPSTIHTCEKCGCKFEYTERDIIKEHKLIIDMMKI